MDLHDLQLAQSSLTSNTPPSKALASLIFINMGFGHSPWRLLLNNSTTIKNEKEGKKERNRGQQYASCKYLLCKPGNLSVEGSGNLSGQVQSILVTMVVRMHKSGSNNSKQGQYQHNQPLGGGYNIVFDQKTLLKKCSKGDKLISFCSGTQQAK